MPAYTENELARMRERAIASAREMQRRAAIKGGEQRQCNVSELRVRQPFWRHKQHIHLVVPK